MEWKQRLAAAVAGLAAVLAPGAAATETDGFVEPVEVLHTLSGTNPGAAYGWAVSELGDVDGDTKSAYLYSGATGRLLHTFSRGRDGDFFGAAVAGAGDVDRDGRADVLVGAPLSDGGGARLRPRLRLLRAHV